MTATEYLDRPPAGWFALDVMKVGPGNKWDWVALMIDAHPDDFKTYRVLTVRQCWVCIPGKHRNRATARDALEDMIATRH